MDISTGWIPRSRASSAMRKRAALPPPERGLKMSTGEVGRSARGSVTRAVSATRAHWTAPAAQTMISTVTSGSRATRSATATTTKTAPIPTRTARAIPRRITPCHALATARRTKANTNSPRGK